MKKKITYLFAFLGMVLSSCLTPVWGQQKTAVGDIEIITNKSLPTNPQNNCQCDTLTVEYFLKAGNAFNPGSDFEFQLTDDLAGWTTITNLSLVDLCLDVNCNAKATTALDTFRTGTFATPPLNHLFARIAIPCNTPVGINALRIVNRQPNGVIAPDGISDTMYFNFGQIPTIADITYARLIDGSVPPENLYTNDTDMAMCPGDTIILRATTDGTQYLWYQNNSPLPGPNGLPIPHSVDSLIVTSSGKYHFEAYNGSCSLASEDTIVAVVNTPTNFAFKGLEPQSFQIDNPKPANLTPDDSVMFCSGSFARFEAVDTTGLNGIVFDYQWLTDTIDPNSGEPVYFRADTSFYSGNTDVFDDSLVFNADRRLISFRPDPAGGSRLTARLYLRIYDGYCADTSMAYNIFMDTIPATEITNRKYSMGLLGPTEFGPRICMKDSVVIRADYPPAGSLANNVRYQWQRSLDGTSWSSLPNANNPNVNGTGRTLQVDTSMKPIRPVTYFRVVTTTVTPFSEKVVCTSTSDSVMVRWYPEDSIRIGTQVTPVAVISANRPVVVNFCEGDTAVVTGPPSPNSFLLPYTYKWITDSVNDFTGQLDKYAIAGATDQIYKITEGGTYWVLIDDGFCTDTVGPVEAFRDSLPDTRIVERRFPNSTLKSFLVCYYDSILLSATDTVPQWNYQWEQYNTTTSMWAPSIGDTFPSVAVDLSYKNSNSDTVYLRLRTSYINQFGLERCPYIADSVKIVFVEPPVTSYFPSDSIGLCEGDSVLVVGSGSGLAYRWNNGEGLTPSFWIKEPGVYPVRVTGVNGCRTFDTVYVYSQQANANAGPDQTINSGETATLSGTGGTEYRWSASKPLNFNDFLSSTIQVSKTLPDSVEADTIQIYLEVRNGQGCIGRDTLTLYVRSTIDKQTRDLQNAYNIITPNGDGRNDEWDIRKFLQGRTGCELMVLNRWGSVVYEDKAFAGIWGGTDNGGNELADGTYYYILSCGGVVQLKSALTIMRNR